LKAKHLPSQQLVLLLVDLIWVRGDSFEVFGHRDDKRPDLVLMRTFSALSLIEVISVSLLRVSRITRKTWSTVIFSLFEPFEYIRHQPI